MTGDKRTTARGFAIHAEIIDSDGQRVRVLQSSAWGMAHCRIQVSDDQGRSVRHWKAGGGWEPARRPGEGDPPWQPGQIMSEGWSGMSAHLSPLQCVELIAALQAHLAMVEAKGLGVDEDDEDEEEDGDE